MAVNMWDSGKTTRQTAKVFCTTQMVTYTKETGSTTKRMAKEPILIRMELNILDNGKTISKTGWGFNNGLMAKNMRVSTKMEQRPGKGCSNF